MKRNLFLLVALLGVAGLAMTISAKTPDGQTPAQEDVCDGLSGAAYGLCNAYCEAQDCDEHPDGRSCDRLRRNFRRLTGSPIFPCDPRCGDGDLDAGEDCDDGNNDACDGCSPECTEEFCGDGVVCPPDEECEPGDICDEDGNICQDDCTCFTPPACPCEFRCQDPDDPEGEVGICRDTDEDGDCECIVACPCEDSCFNPAHPGQVGICRDTDGDFVCECVTNPPACECDNFCFTADGEEGACRDPNFDGICECVTLPPACECGDDCTTDGVVGLCRDPDDDGDCECVAPPACPCGDTCTTIGGEVGTCRDLNEDGICGCIANTPACPCGEICTTEDGEVGTCDDCDGDENCECVAVTPPASECIRTVPICSGLVECTTPDGCQGACFFTVTGPAVCFAGNFFCRTHPTCDSDSDCDPGFACSNTCCGLECAPLCQCGTPSPLGGIPANEGGARRAALSGE